VLGAVLIEGGVARGPSGGARTPPEGPTQPYTRQPGYWAH
jgi:hypothetical protein